MIDQILNKKTNQQEDEGEVHRNFLKEQQTVDIATANETLDYTNQNDRSDLLKWQQDLDDELVRLRYRLKSFTKYEDGKWGPRVISVGKDKEGEPVYQRTPPLANDLFIDYVESQVEPFLSRNLFSSNLNEKRILEILRNTCDDIGDAMADGYDIYEIEFINYDLVMRLIKNMIIPGPFRALNDGQRRHDRTIAKRIEAFNERGPGKEKKKTMMGVNLE